MWSRVADRLLQCGLFNLIAIGRTWLDRQSFGQQPVGHWQQRAVLASVVEPEHSGQHDDARPDLTWTGHRRTQLLRLTVDRFFRFVVDAALH